MYKRFITEHFYEIKKQDFYNENNLAFFEKLFSKTITEMKKKHVELKTFIKKK